MAEEGTLAINADVAKLAGAQASTISTAEAYTNFYIKLAEGNLCKSARYNWVTKYSTLSDIGKEILRDATASFAAVKAIEYDMGGFTSRQEALIMINILWDSYQKLIDLFEKDEGANYREFIVSGVGTVE